MKCCGGDHPASYRGCPNYVKAENVERIRKENKISYAEAVRSMEGTSDARQVQAVSVSRDPTRDC